MQQWSTGSWRVEVLTWALEHGVRPNDRVGQPTLRPWSTVLRLPTSDGVVWLKAVAPGCAFEAGLTQALADLRAPHVLRPLAVDADRGWLLLPDGGPTLRETRGGLADWERVLVGYAELQRTVAGRELPGLEDLSPARLPALLDTLLDEVGGSVPVETLADLRGLQPRFASWCEELDDSGIATTLQHDDLHDANVFADGTVFDFGDACLAHPFSTLLVTQRVAAQSFDLAADAPELRRLRDAYLEPWTATHSRAELELLALFAVRVGKVGRARAWQRALHGVDDPGQHAEAVPGWLEELLEPDTF